MTVGLSVRSNLLTSPWSQASWTSKSGLRLTTLLSLMVVHLASPLIRPQSTRRCVCLLRTSFCRLVGLKNQIHLNSPTTTGDGLTCTTTRQPWWHLSTMITNILAVMVVESTLAKNLQIKAMLSLLCCSCQPNIFLRISLLLKIKNLEETKTRMTMVWPPYQSRESSQQFLMWTLRAWRATMIISSATYRTDRSWRLEMLSLLMINLRFRWWVADAMTLAWITLRHRSRCLTEDETFERSTPMI